MYLQNHTFNSTQAAFQAYETPGASLRQNGQNQRNIRFGNAPIPLPRWIKPVDGLFQKGLNTRTKEMLLEDLMGFALLRTGIDLYRQRIMGEGTRDKHGHEELNIPAARERLLREVSSILTDNVSGGIFAFAIAVLANRFTGAKNLSQHFVSEQSLALFSDIVGKLPSSAFSSHNAFEEALIKSLAKEFNIPQAELCEVYRDYSAQAGKVAKQGSQLLSEREGKIARLIRKNNPRGESFSLARQGIIQPGVAKNLFEFPELLEDTRHFLNKLPKTDTGRTIETVAQKLLADSGRLNKLQYLGIALALGLTMLVPFTINAMTRHLDGIANYPGERGIRDMKQVNPNDHEGPGNTWLEKHFPYMSELIQRKSPILLLPLLPLALAMGLFDTRALSRFAFKEAFNAPWKKAFIPRLKEMYQFGKGVPFTTQQQMASCFAFLIFSRMVTARSDIEFRERSVDSLLGWTTWILGTPILKRGLSRLLEKQMAGTRLFNRSGVLRTRAEIEHFPIAGENRSRSLSAHLLTRFSSVIFTILTLGILEPVAAIKWTAHQGKKHEDKKETAGLNKLSLNNISA